jgi:hypothetical protein
MNIGSRIGSAAKAMAIGGAIAAATAGPIVGGAYGLKRILSKPEQQSSQSETSVTSEYPAQSQETTSDDSPKEKTFHETFHENLQSHFEKKYPAEYPVIVNAAKRNGIPETDHENLAVLFAIREAENGRHGKQFGVLHKNAAAKPGETHLQSLDRQAGWAASTLMKNRARYDQAVKEGKTNKPFVEHFGNIWAPIGVANDPTNLNKHWIGNVSRLVNTHMNPE